MPAPEPSNGSSPAGPSITGPSAAGPSRMAVMSRGPPAAAAGAAGRSFLATERSGLSRHSGSGLDDNDDGEDEVRAHPVCWRSTVGLLRPPTWCKHLSLGPYGRFGLLWACALWVWPLGAERPGCRCGGVPGLQGSVWIVEPRPVPPLGPSSRHLMHVVMPGTPRALFDCVLADSAPFFEDFLDSQVLRRNSHGNSYALLPFLEAAGHCIFAQVSVKPHAVAAGVRMLVLGNAS